MAGGVEGARRLGTTARSVSGPIRAAGGVPVRGRGATAEVLLIHRRRYDDWTFPKGKVERGETDEACALREVEEETGLVCELGPELASTSYPVGDRPKRVRYWLLRVVGGDLAARPGEIDEVRWLPLEAARALLTHEHDLPVLDGARAAA